MKSTITFLLFFVTITLFSQNPLEKIIGEFNEVKVYDLIEVNLVKSDESKVVITGDDVDYVEVLIKNNILKIRMKLDKIYNGNRTFVAVHYTNLKIVDGNEGSVITSNEMIEQDIIELKAQEGAHLKIGLEVENVTIKAVSGGIIETKGKGNSQNVNLNTGGIYNGKAFETKTTDVSIKAAGEAEVNASEIVNAKVRAGGNINIYGQPKTINESTAFGGRVKRMD